MRQLIAALGTDPARTKMTRVKTLPAKTLATGTAVARIKRAMADVKPLVDWLRAHVG